ncbi:MAG: tRNA(Ile)-lysidine synthetase [Acidimicrobiales bacterium]
MKCRVCREPAVIDVRRQNANYCTEHFLRMCRDQVAKAIDEHDMIRPGQRVLVAVSGGKDSLAVWDILRGLGYEADGFCIGLGIGDYSDESSGKARAFAADRGWPLEYLDLRDDYGFDVPTAAHAIRRVPCSACGLSKRHLFDDAARRGGYDVVATGHNLDDECAVLFGNVLRWQTEYLGRQLPVLPARSGFPRKVKPLVRLGERETAAYCVLLGIDYIVEECPMAEGNKHLGYKEALNAIEARSPGSKLDFYLGFLRRGHERFASDTRQEADELGLCERCGAPTTGEVCAFCRLVEAASVAEPVAFTPGRGRRRR